MVQGTVSDAMYIIIRGKVRVERTHPHLTAPVTLAELGPNEVVGEMGVLDHEPRSATVVAIEDTEALMLGASALAETILRYPQFMVSLLHTLSQRLRGLDDLAAQLAMLSASQETPDALAMLTQLDLFQALPEQGIAKLPAHARRRHFPASSILMRQGDESESAFILLTGRVKVERSHPNLKDHLVLAEIGPGEVVGELGMLEQERRSATVTALEDTEALELPAPLLSELLSQFPSMSNTLLRTLSRRIRSTDELLDVVLERRQESDEPNSTP
jgi:CRP-like cAMP-binding protein